MVDEAKPNGHVPHQVSSSEIDSMLGAASKAGLGYDDMPPELRALTTSLIYARYQFARAAGLTFGGRRDVKAVLGYEETLSLSAYWWRYTRGGLAGAVVDALPDAAFRGSMTLTEDLDDDTETPFEQAWKDFDQRLGIQGQLLRSAKLARLSTYSIILIGAPGDLDTELPPGRPDQLLFLEPFLGGGGPTNLNNSMNLPAADIGDATISEMESDYTSERFGLPKTYMLRRTDVMSPSTQRPVHWSRVIHDAEYCLRDRVYGQPALERVWNLFDDLEKVTGGGAEAFWLRANQGLHLDIDKDMSLSNAEAAASALKEQSEDYKHQLTRWLRTRGVNVQTLGSDVANFSQPADAIITQIAGAKRMPKRILMGSEMGELASSQDRDNWKDQVNGYQTQQRGPVIRELASRLIKYGYLPTPSKGVDKFDVKWPHIEVLSENEKAKGAQQWASTNQAMGETVFTNDEIRKHWYNKGPLASEEIKPMGPAAVAQGDMGESVEGEEAPVFPRAAARRKVTSQDDELVRVLAAAIEAGNEDVVNKIIGLQHKHGTTQVEVSSDRLSKMAARIDAADLVGKGVQIADAHVTVRYGVDVSHDAVAVALRGIAPGFITLGKTNWLVNADGEGVVYVEALDTDGVLGRMRQAIEARVPVTENTYKDYKPHITLAYVKADEAEKYAGMNDVEGQRVYVSKLTVRDRDGVPTEVALG